MLDQLSYPILFIITAVAAWCIGMGLIPQIIRLSHKFGWYDGLGDRKVHTEPTSRLGGVALFLATLVSVLLVSVGAGVFLLDRFMIFVLLGVTLGFMLGLIDDFRNIPAKIKLVGQIAAGVLIVSGGAQLEGFSIPVIGVEIFFGPLSGVFTVFWLISIANALNLMDGIDGLAGGISCIAAVFSAIVHAMTGNTFGLVFSAALVGSMVGFLSFNLPLNQPAERKIFMGDSGSLFLGFSLGSLLFIRNGDVSETALAVSATLLMLPILDMLASIMRRLWRGIPVFSPDREHLHHKLLDFGSTVPQILMIGYAGSIVAGAAAVFWMFAQTNGREMVRLYGDVSLLAVWVAGLAFFLIIHIRNKRRKTMTA